jgi:hypothetical protein
MKNVLAARMMAHSQGGGKAVDDIDLLMDTLDSNSADHTGAPDSVDRNFFSADVSPGLFGGCLRASAAWAEAEARCPDRIRLFFIDDFITDPAVAMGGLARFFGVSDLSVATERAMREAARVVSISHVQPASQHIRDLLNVSTLEELTQTFESLIMKSSAGVQARWEQQLTRWLQSPNPRLTALASGVLRHEPWNPARWWAVHCARVCRPCIFFPRGKCSDDSCGYCHGPGHAKPKRPSHARRKQRRAYDRTPSPPSIQRHC